MIGINVVRVSVEINSVVTGGCKIPHHKIQSDSEYGKSLDINIKNNCNLSNIDTSFAE
jgi:hypothetical protein